ncbi:MAG: hypothetical protein Q8891_12245 [Bacteroidota bacterium]|nr:hypothetical protein [Bacteroidota bacterium]
MANNLYNSDDRSKVRQFQYESDKLKRKLAFLLQENAHLKNRLAEVLKLNFMPGDFLETAEQFQNIFIQEDMIINLIRQDVAGMDILLARDICEDGNIIKTVIPTHKKICNELKKIETIFIDLKARFNNYLLENAL